MLVDEPERVTHLVSDRPAIPIVGTDAELLRAADHPDRGTAAELARHIIDHHIIHLRRALDEMDIRKRLPLARTIEKSHAIRRAHRSTERVIHIAARPFVDAGLRGAVRRGGARQLIAPESHGGHRHDHVAKEDRGLAGLHVGEHGLVRGDRGGVRIFLFRKKWRAETERDEHSEET